MTYFAANADFLRDFMLVPLTGHTMKVLFQGVQEHCQVMLEFKVLLLVPKKQQLRLLLRLVVDFEF